jgi:hypothetical protein
MTARRDSAPAPLRWGRVAGVAALTLALALCVLSWRQRAAPPELEPVRRQQASAHPEQPTTTRRPRPISAAASSVVSPPVIDAVIVEKPELCEGEETLVSVRAHTTNDADAELHFTIGAGSGQSVPLRVWSGARGEPLPIRVTAFGRDNAATTVLAPPPRILPCQHTQRVVLSHRVLPNRWGSFELRARVLDTRGGAGADGTRPASGARAQHPTPFQPRRYTWSFGDGSQLVTTESLVVHSYEERPQDTLYAQLLVRVEVSSDDGRTLVGRDALQLLNPAYESLSRKGIVSLMTALDPPFPRLDADGVVRQRVRLWHHRPETVRIASISRSTLRGEGGATRTEDVDVSSVLGTDEIAPGHGVELETTLDTSAEPDVVAVSYVLHGTSPEGYPVRGAFSVMRPPPAPTRSNSRPVTDPALSAKIQRARQLLGRDVVSDADLFALQHSGQLDEPSLPRRL